ncbi:MAG: type IV pili methyl-accepting chemotaxis transducer N-terminal domain-containing protein [Bacteroidota bacterium]
MSINKHFIKGAVITVLIIIFNQVLIQFWLYQKRQDSHAINVAGRQRMLSQRISLEFHKMHYSKVDTDLINNLYDQWYSAHYAFINSNESMDITAITSKEIKDVLISLSEHVKFVKPFLDDSTLSDSEISSIYNNQNVFLDKMELVVSLMENRSQFKLNIIIIGEIVLAIISIIILLLEIRFIYKPVTEQQIALVKSQKSILKNQEKKLNKIAWEQSHLVRSPIASLSGLTYMFMNKSDSLTEDDKKKIIHYIEIETNRLNKIVSETVRLTYQEQD